jgi:hypothetical protein
MSAFLYVSASILTDPILGIIIGVTCGLVGVATTKTTSIECEYIESLVKLGFDLLRYVL